MSRKLSISCLELVVLFSLVAVGAPSQSRPATGTPASVSRHRPEGFLDYALGKINPNGIDYGALVRGDRNAVVRHTIDDLYFWSNVVTLILLTGIVALVLFQSRSAEKREMVAASLIAQLWNGRVSDGVEIERRTEEFNQLVAAHNAETERSLTLKSHSEAPSDLKRTVETRYSEHPDRHPGARSWERFLAQMQLASPYIDIEFAQVTSQLGQLLHQYRAHHLALPSHLFSRVWFLHYLRGAERIVQTRAVVQGLTEAIQPCAFA